MTQQVGDLAVTKDEPVVVPTTPTRRNGFAAVATAALLALSLLAAWLVAYALLFSKVQEERSQRILFGQLRGGLAAGTAPLCWQPPSETCLGGRIEEGRAVALLKIPAAGVHSVIVEGTSSGDLRAGPGHQSDTVLPGQAGVSVVDGRSVTFGAPFAKLTKLGPGDTLTATTGQGVATYVVDDVRRPGDALPQPLAAGGSRIVLVSSTGGRLAPQRVVYVDATLKGKAFDVPAGMPNAIAASEQPMQGDSTALVPLVLWLQALILVAVGFVWARARWGLWQTWLVGVPLLAATVWSAGGVALELLPNLT